MFGAETDCVTETLDAFCAKKNERTIKEYFELSTHVLLFRYEKTNLI